jgi:HlyD family secretion protein
MNISHKPSNSGGVPMKIAVRRCALGLAGGLVAAALLLFTAPQGHPANDIEPNVPALKLLKLAGRIEPVEQTQIYSRIVGFVQTVQVDLGDRVKKGQLLAEQSVPQMVADLRQKEALAVHAVAQVHHAELLMKDSKATFVTAAAHIKEAEAGVRVAQAKLEESKAALERFKKLLEEKAIDSKIVDERAAHVELAKAALDEAQFRVHTAQATHDGSANNVHMAEIGIKSAIAQRDAARAAAAHSAAMLNYAKLVAPFDGVITQRAADVGMLAGPPGARGEPLFTVTRMDMARAVVAVPQEDAAHVKRGDDAVVLVGTQEFKGKVSRTAGALDPQKSTLRVEIDLPNSDGKLLTGMAATVTITLAKE